MFQPGVEDCFEPLLTKRTSCQLYHLADEPVDFATTSEHAMLEQMRKSVENMYISPSREALEGGEERVNPLSPIENFRSPSPAEDHDSFYQLLPDYGLPKNALGMTPSVEEEVVSIEEDLCFIELPVAPTDPKHEAGPGTVIANEDRGMDRSPCATYPVGEHSSLQAETLLTSAQEASSEILISPEQNPVCQSGCVPDTHQTSSSSATPLKSFDSCFSQSGLPAWVSESRTNSSV